MSHTDKHTLTHTNRRTFDLLEGSLTGLLAGELEGVVAGADAVTLTPAIHEVAAGDQVLVAGLEPQQLVIVPVFVWRGGRKRI